MKQVNTLCRKGYVATGLFLVPMMALSIVGLLYMLLPVTSVLARGLNLSISAAGWLTTGFGLTYAAGFLVWGPLSDRYGRSRIIVCGIALLSLVTFGLSAIENVACLVALRCLQGALASSFSPVALAWLAERLTGSSRRWSIALISCAFLVAGTLGQWYGATFVPRAISAAMLPLAMFYAASGSIFYAVTRREWRTREMSTAVPMSARLVMVGMLRTLKTPALVGLYACAFFVLMSFISLYLFLGQMSARGAIPLSLGTLRSIATIGMLSCLLSGLLFERCKPTWVLGISLMVMSAMYGMQLILLLFSNWNEPLFLGCHVLFVVSMALAIPAMITCVSLLSSPKYRGIAMSLYTFILFLGASLGSMASSYHAVEILSSFIIAILMLAGGGVCIVQLRMNRRMNMGKSASSSTEE